MNELTFVDIPIPHPETVKVFEELDKIEPRAMHGQPKVIWHKAEGCYVYDEFNNRFIDFTSGVLIANCGHNHPRINAAIRNILDQGLLTSYIFVNKERIRLIKKILEHAPENLDQVLLFCTGSEAIEVSIKLAKMFAVSNFSSEKNYVLTFNGNFHGRTLGAQLAGGIPSLKNWIISGKEGYLHMPFPDIDIEETCNFDIFLSIIQKEGVLPKNISCLVFETYQGGVVKFAPPSFMQKLRHWCTENNIIMIFDEVQAGFGRTGKWWGFEHYDVVPDLIVCGKGISSSLPVSAVIGNRKVMDQFSPGALSTTHSGNPLCTAAATENITVLEDENLIENAQNIGAIMHNRIQIIISHYKESISGAYGKGLVCGIQLRDASIAQKIVDNCVASGLMLFNPVGPTGTTIKLNPPLNISEEILHDGLNIFEKCLANALKQLPRHV